MSKITSFLEYNRVEPAYEPAPERIRHYNEFIRPLSAESLHQQASRCMDCGVPYCHTGCPVNNQIPDWNELVYLGQWEQAIQDLHSTNNFPEFTGRTCPAPCEEACTLNLEDQPVTIKTIEDAIVERAWKEGWVNPELAQQKSGKSVAIIGAGPAGLAAAQQLARAGHDVHLYDREIKPGGLLRYGIPDFKMEKWIIDRRFEQLKAEGVVFHGGHNIESEADLSALKQAHDAVLLACGAEHPRDAGIEIDDLQGVYKAMPYLVQQNRMNAGEPIGDQPHISAAGKHVVVVGGGDTASDCVGTAFRQGALSVTQVDIRPKPPKHEDKLVSWPEWAVKMRTSSSQAEGAERLFWTASLGVIGRKGKIEKVRFSRVDDARKLVPNSEFTQKCDLLLEAIGFAGAADIPFIKATNLDMTDRNTVKADPFSYKTSVEGVYAAGDMRRGQSLVVWAIREGRQAARAIDLDLMGATVLPS